MFKGLHTIDYKKKRKEVTPTFCKTREDIPDGIWLSFDTVAHLINNSRQTIHLLYLAGQIKVIKFPKGPMLANLVEVENLKAENEPLKI